MSKSLNNCIYLSDTEEELRKKNPTKFAAKKLAKGTAKGILAGTLGINLFDGDSSK